MALGPPGQPFGSPYGQPFGQPNGQPYGQPTYGQPAYGQMDYGAPAYGNYGAYAQGGSGQSQGMSSGAKTLGYTYCNSLEPTEPFEYPKKTVLSFSARA